MHCCCSDCMAPTLLPSLTPNASSFKFIPLNSSPPPSPSLIPSSLSSGPCGCAVCSHWHGHCGCSPVMIMMSWKKKLSVLASSPTLYLLLPPRRTLWLCSKPPASWLWPLPPSPPPPPAGSTSSWVSVTISSTAFHGCVHGAPECSLITRLFLYLYSCAL